MCLTSKMSIDMTIKFIQVNERAVGLRGLKPCVATDSDDEKGGDKKVERSDQL